MFDVNVASSIQLDLKLEEIRAQEVSWHCVSFISYNKKNDGKVTIKYIFYNVGTFPLVLFELNKYYNKKKRKNSLREEVSKLLSILKSFYINVLQLETINLSDVLLNKSKISVTIRHIVFTIIITVIYYNKIIEIKRMLEWSLDSASLVWLLPRAWKVCEYSVTP